MKRTTKKRVSICLSFIMVLSLFYTALSVNPAKVVKAAGYGLSNPRIDSDGVATWDCIYFGNYWQNDTNGDGKADKNDEKQPIKWRVLSVDGDDAFLLADQNLDCQKYNEEWKDVTWETCTLRKWLNNEFCNIAFSISEQNAIRITTVVTRENFHGESDGGNDTEDKIYVLSIREVKNLFYGFSSDGEKSGTREAKNTEYTKEKGAETYDGDDGNGNWSNGKWWLRFPGGYGGDYCTASKIYTNGEVDANGSFVTQSDIAIRPALHLNLSSSKWSKAGTVSSSEAGSAGAMPTVTPDNKEEMRKPQQPENRTDEKVTPLAKLASLKAINKNGKKISLLWEKIKEAKGYQIQYADNKKWKKKKSKWTKKTKYTIKKLKKKKTYYIRVRAYKLDGSKKVYGSWSKVKKVKVKK